MDGDKETDLNAYCVEHGMGNNIRSKKVLKQTVKFIFYISGLTCK